MRATVFLPLVLIVLAMGCNHAPIQAPPGIPGQNWHPAPNGKWALEIIDHRASPLQGVRFRHGSKPDHNGLIDELQRPGSLLWAPSSRHVVINHRDSESRHDFRLFSIEANSPLPQPQWLARVEDLWERLHPQPMSRVSFRAARFESRGRALLVIASGELEATTGIIVTEGMLIDFDREVVTHVADPAGLVTQWQGR